MKAFARLLALFALFAVCLSAIDAQVAQDNPKKTDEAKGDDKKAEKKVVDKAPPVAVKEDVVRNAKKLRMRVKEVKMDDENKEVVKEIVVSGQDEKKQAEFLVWEQKFKQQIQNSINIGTQKKFSPQEQDEIYRREAAKHLDGVYSLDPKTISVSTVMRVRTLTEPKFYDEKNGKERKMTAAELSKKKGGSTLPGYPVDVVAVRPGQIVDVYLPKTAFAPPPKQPATPPPATKKGFIRGDDTLVGGNPNSNMPRAEAYMILIIQD